LPLLTASYELGTIDYDLPKSEYLVFGLAHLSLIVLAFLLPYK